MMMHIPVTSINRISIETTWHVYKFNFLPCTSLPFYLSGGKLRHKGTEFVVSVTRNQII